MTFGDGMGSTVDLDSQGSAGALRHYAIGSFVADGSNQTLSIVAPTANNVHINGYQIRTAVPPPVISSHRESGSHYQRRILHAELANQRGGKCRDQPIGGECQCYFRKYICQPSSDNDLYAHCVQRRRISHF